MLGTVDPRSFQGLVVTSRIRIREKDRSPYPGRQGEDDQQEGRIGIKRLGGNGSKVNLEMTFDSLRSDNKSTLLLALGFFFVPLRLSYAVTVAGVSTHPLQCSFCGCLPELLFHLVGLGFPPKVLLPPVLPVGCS